MTSGFAQLVYIPDIGNTASSDHSGPTGTAVALNHTFDDPTGGHASATFTGKLQGGNTVLGTGIWDNIAATPGNQQFYFADTKKISDPNTLYVSKVYGNAATGSLLLQDSRFGYVVIQQGTGTSGNAAIGGLYTGNATPVAQLPVQATYNGSFVGVIAKQGQSFGATYLTSPMTMTANFTQGTIAGSMNSFFGNYFATFDGIAFNGKITGNTYSGTATFTDITGVAVPAPRTSAVTGGFFGPNAAETAGALRIEGQTPQGKGSVSVVTGGFGAHR